MMSKLLFFIKTYSPTHFSWALLSGALIGTSYMPFPPWAILFGYAPLWLFLFYRAKTWQQGFAAGWWTQFVLSIIGFHWVSYVTHRFGGFPWAFAVLVLILFAAAVHLYIPVAAAVIVALKERYRWGLAKTLFASALSLSLIERAWPSIFPWHLGYTLLPAKLPAYQWADVIGFEGLATVILLFNAWLAWIWVHRKDRLRLGVHSIAAIVLAALINISGYYHALPWNSFDRQLHASIIQANIGDLEKVMAEKGQGYQSDIVRTFIRLSTAAVKERPNTELLIWPETAYPDYLDNFNAQNRLRHQLAAGLSPLGKTLLAGAYSKDPPGTVPMRLTYNGLFLVDSAGMQVGPPYHKTDLLAFGEYLPLSERFPSLLKLLPFIANFGRGKGPEVLNFPHPEGDLKIGGQICYEGLYPAFTRGLSEKQADILVNVTNDAWFGEPAEPRQHMYMTLARAIEVRRPLLRSTNTGISTAILANGEILQQSPTYVEWFGTFDVLLRRNPPTTDFVLWGHYDWILIAVALFALFCKGVMDARPDRP
jgi:apolipoprotein N-acyltransferase